MEKIKSVQNHSKWRENCTNMFFGLFWLEMEKIKSVPNHPKWREYWTRHGKNENCSKMPKIKRKVEEHFFVIFIPHPLKVET